MYFISMLKNFVAGFLFKKPSAKLSSYPSPCLRLFSSGCSALHEERQVEREGRTDVWQDGVEQTRTDEYHETRRRAAICRSSQTRT